MLDRLIEQRRQIVDEIVWQDDTPQEGKRQWAGLLQRGNIDAAGATVDARFEQTV